MSHLLIYDADLFGHHRDYLDALVNYVESHSPLNGQFSQISFMLPMAYWASGNEKRSLKHATRIDIPQEFLKERNALPPRQQARLEVALLADIAQTHNVSEIMLMNLDYFQIALASPLAHDIPCQISGIQLQPYTRSELVARQVPSKPALWFRALRKRFRLQQMLKNIQMANLFIPADTAAVTLMNKRYKKLGQAVMLPEPYLGKSNDSATQKVNTAPDIHERYGLQKGCRIILIFGTLTTRKNSENVIRAMSMLHQSGHENAVLLIVGKATPKYQSTLRTVALEDKAVHSSIHFDFDFVEDAVLRALFQTCDIVAMPYSKAYQSSGILFQAVHYGKPVIAANLGLVNDLVNQYELGESVNPTNPQQIYTAMTKLIDNWTPSPKANALIECHTANNHADIILNHERQILRCDR